jgi:hypothetical protein
VILIRASQREIYHVGIRETSGFPAASVAAKVSNDVAATARKIDPTPHEAAAGVAVAERSEAEADTAVVEIDDILGEIGAPARTDEPAYSLEDILGDFDASPQAVAEDGFDDFFTDVGAPVQAAAVESPDSIPHALAPLPTADSLDEALGAVVIAPSGDEADVDPPIEEPEAIPAKRSHPKTGFLGLGGTRQISRKAYLALIGLTGLFGLTAAAETAFIVAHGIGHGDTKPRRVVVTMAPVDYAHIDLKRYVGKRRALHEGGRDVLRNGAVKAAILELDNGEDLYREVREIARHSPTADHLAIGDDRLTVASCDTGVCGDKSFRLVYDLVRKQASVCITEKYLNNSFLSYSYSEEGYSEVAGCR